MMEPRDRIIVALDVPSVDDAMRLVSKLKGSVGVYKIGLELLFNGGFQLARELADKGLNVFIDAKLLDIEATDAAGNRTTLARGTSRIVFYVR